METGSSISIAKFRDFVSSRKVLEEKACYFLEQGYGQTSTTKSVVVHRTPWQPVSEVPNSDKEVCFDATFRITRLPSRLLPIVLA